MGYNLRRRFMAHTVHSSASQRNGPGMRCEPGSACYRAFIAPIISERLLMRQAEDGKRPMNWLGEIGY